MIEEIQDPNMNKKLMLQTFDYVDFGGDVMEDEILDSFSNNDFDDLDDDSEDEMYEGDYDELEDAIEYALDLKLPSLEGAIDRVGSNGSLFSWVEGRMKDMGEEELKEYEKLTGEIDLNEGYIKDGLKKIFSTLTENIVIVSESSVSFCKELFERFAAVALETSFQVSSLRENKTITASDITEAMKMLGRNVYFDSQDDEDNVATIFDYKLIKSLVDFVKNDFQLEEDVYHIIQHSFEDFLYTIMKNALILQKTYRNEEPISVNDMMMVLHMWNQSPCNSGSYLIQKLFCK